MDVSFCAAAQIEALNVFRQFLLAKELEILAIRKKQGVKEGELTVD